VPTGPGRGGAAGAPPAPEPDLMAASAMVFVSDPAAPVLTEDDVHHLVDVLRLRSGELVIAGDGAGSWAPCRVRAGPGSRGSRGVDPTSVLSVEGPVVFRPRPAPEITVAFAPVKGDRPEWVTQKLTEVGVDRIVPLRVARSVVRWEGDRGRRAVARLSRVAREAAAQCRRPWLPEVAEVTTLDGLALLAAPAAGPTGRLARLAGPPGGGGGSGGGLGRRRTGPIRRRRGVGAHRAPCRDRRHDRRDPLVHSA
jgi:hypothetical protein